MDTRRLAQLSLDRPPNISDYTDALPRGATLRRLAAWIIPHRNRTELSQLDPFVV